MGKKKKKFHKVYINPALGYNKDYNSKHDEEFVHEPNNPPSAAVLKLQKEMLRGRFRAVKMGNVRVYHGMN